MKLFCLFSIQNDYDQPRHNLEVCWGEKPSFDELAKGLGMSGFPASNDEATLYVIKLWEGVEAQRWCGGTTYFLKEVEQRVPLL